MNELTSLLKRCLEGRGYTQSDFEDAATAIAWLESHGMNGLDLVSSQWIPDNDSPVSIVTGESCTSKLKLNTNNVAFCGRMIVDLACSHATDFGIGQLEVHHCVGRRAIMASLANCSARGLNAIAYWSDGDNLYVASITAAQPAPELRHLSREIGIGTNPEHLYIVCSSESQVTTSLSNTLLRNDSLADKFTSSVDFAARYDAALNSGIHVDDTVATELARDASAVLVESTEQSRMGAGE